jgi:hypothetical protein
MDDGEGGKSDGDGDKEGDGEEEGEGEGGESDGDGKEDGEGGKGNGDGNKEGKGEEEGKEEGEGIFLSSVHQKLFVLSQRKKSVPISGPSQFTNHKFATATHKHK